MGRNDFDHAQFKAAQRRDWGSAAPGWVKWWERIEEGAGFREFGTAPEPVTFVYSCADEYVEMTKELAAPITALMAKETEERQAELWEKVAEACSRYKRADGQIEMENEAICVWGRK